MELAILVQVPLTSWEVVSLPLRVRSEQVAATIMGILGTLAVVPIPITMAIVPLAPFGMATFSMRPFPIIPSLVVALLVIATFLALALVAIPIPLSPPSWAPPLLRHRASALLLHKAFQFGALFLVFLMLLLVELLQGWKWVKNPCVELFKILALVAFLLCMLKLHGMKRISYLLVASTLTK